MTAPPSRSGASCAPAGETPAERARRRAILIAVALAEGALIIASTSRYGVGLSADSAAYISTARHVAGGGGFAMFDGTPYVMFPPLYPLVLAAGQLATGLDPLHVARAVNALLGAALVLLAGLWGGRRRLRGGWLAILAPVSVFLSIPLFNVSVMAWSEPLFAVLVFGSLLALESELRRGDLRSLGALTACVAGACLTRYVGVFLIPTTVAALLAVGRDRVALRIGRAFVFAMVALLPVVIWCARNFHVTGTLFGPRTASDVAFLEAAGLAFHTALSWVLPERVIRRGPVLSAWVGVLAVMIALRAAALRRRAVDSAAALAPLAIFLFGYTGLLVTSSTITAYDRIGDRLMSAIYLPAALIALWTVAPSNEHDPDGVTPRAVRWISVGLVGLWFLYAGSFVALGAWKRIQEGGGGFNSRPWRESRIVDYVKTRLGSEPGALYSNMPEALYLLVGATAKLSPMKGGNHSTAVGAPLSAYEGSWPGTSVSHLVWFNGLREGDVYPPHDLEVLARLSPIMRARDGTVYLVERLENRVPPLTEAADSVSFREARP